MKDQGRFELCGTATDNDGIVWEKYFARMYQGRVAAAPTFRFVNTKTGKHYTSPPCTYKIKKVYRPATIINGRHLPADTIVERIGRSISFKSIKCECGSGRPIHYCTACGA